MIPRGKTSQLYVPEGGQQSQFHRCWDHEEIPWRGMKKNHNCPDAVNGSVAGTELPGTPLYMDSQGEHSKLPRWGGPGACWGSSHGSGEDTDAEDASERVWEKADS